MTVWQTYYMRMLGISYVVRLDATMATRRWRLKAGYTITD